MLSGPNHAGSKTHRLRVERIDNAPEFVFSRYTRPSLGQRRRRARITNRRARQARKANR